MIAARAAALVPGRVYDLLAWPAAIAAVAVVARQAGAGIDPSDEAFYLQAVMAPARDDAFNGFFGLYLRPLWALAGWDVARVRVLGLAVLVGVAVLLGLAVARLARQPRATVVAMTVAASTGYYAATWRIPSYNWLALVGAGLVCAGLLRLLAGDGPAWGAVCGLGVAVAAAGKVPSAALLAGLVVVTAWRRRSALGWGAGALAVAAAVHLLVVLPPADTLRLVRRSAAMVSTVSPGSYSVPGALTTFLSGWGGALVVATVGGGAVGLLPLALAKRGPRRAAWFRLICTVVVTASVVVALAGGVWSGGTSRLGITAGVLPVLLAVLTAAALAALLGLNEPAPRPWVAGSAVLTLAAAACVFGSNTFTGWQLNTMTLLLAPACLLLGAVLASPRPGGIVGLVVTGMCLGSLLTVVQAHDDPYRSAPLAEATAPVALGRVTARTDPDTARQVHELVAAARAAGWSPGTPLVDTTFTPLLPLALEARVPPVLLPAFPGYDLASVCRAVRGLSPQWRDAWLVVLPGASDDQNRQVASYLGRRYPGDYVQVATFDPRWAEFGGRLLRPRVDAPPVPGSCLAG